jgi:ech hydrogenase subunit D
MFIEQQELVGISREELGARVAAMKQKNARLVQICCTAGDQYELTYSFDCNKTVTNLRLMLSASDLNLPSITGTYLAAFTYENELHDLFGISFSGLAIDFKGDFYRIAVKTPFAKKPQGTVE